MCGHHKPCPRRVRPYRSTTLTAEGPRDAHEEGLLERLKPDVVREERDDGRREELVGTRPRRGSVPIKPVQRRDSVPGIPFRYGSCRIVVHAEGITVPSAALMAVIANR